MDTLTYAGNPSDQQRYLRITEIMYNPAPGGMLDNEEYEFIELKNIGTDLSQARRRQVDQRRVLHFPADGQRCCWPPAPASSSPENRAAFASRYSNPSIRLAPGVYTGSLDNAGETIKLEDRTNGTILEFKYEDRWYKTTDGLGYSLTIKDPANANLDSWSDPAAWCPSPQSGGSPGTP